MALPLIFAMYGGETATLEFSFETDNCTIVPNETEGIDFNFTGNQVIVEPALNFVGEFNITCYDWKTKETESHSSGGGPAIADWSAKCLYNLECLYGSNYTQTEIDEINQTSEINDTQAEIDEPIPEDKELSWWDRFVNWLKKVFGRKDPDLL